MICDHTRALARATGRALVLYLVASAGALVARGQTPTGTGSVRPMQTMPPFVLPPNTLRATPSLRGFVDLHTHPLANLGFGGKLLYGGVDVGSLLPADPDCHHSARATSEAQALGHDKSTHGGYNLLDNPCGDVLREAFIHGLQGSLGAADPSSDARGYPDFADWPAWNDLTHQKMWVEWIRRAYQGGLRVMVALAVNNKTLGDMTAGPGDYPTDDKSSADLQIIELKNFVDRHPDFMQLAYSSADVQRIVSQNKLAVILGVEVDHLGNFGVRTGPIMPWAYPAPPSELAVREEIARLYGEGVRYVFPVHVLDNAFGGTAAYVNLFNVSSWRETGRPYDLVCADARDHIGYVYSNDIEPQTVALQLAKTGFAINSIAYPSCASGQKNRLGLTLIGTFAIKEMMRHGMLIDIDHMSQAAADEALALSCYGDGNPELVPQSWGPGAARPCSLGYPVNSGHNGLRGSLPGTNNERALRADQYWLIGQLHGMAGVGSAGLDAATWLREYIAVEQAMGGGSVVAGFGTDFNGLAFGMPPRRGTPGHFVPGPDSAAYQACYQTCCSNAPDPERAGNKANGASKQCDLTCRKKFPHAFVEIPGKPGSQVQYGPGFAPSRDGVRTWDYNTVGVANYGMLWDFLQDVRSLPGGSEVVDNNFMYGADYLFHTWQLAEAKSKEVK